MVVNSGKKSVIQTEQIDYASRFQDTIFFHLAEQSVVELTDFNKDFSPETFNSPVVYRQPSNFASPIKSLCHRIALPTSEFSSPSSEHTLESNL